MVALAGGLLLLLTLHMLVSLPLAKANGAGQAELLDECEFDCQSSADCKPGLLCAAEFGPALVTRGYSPTAADCDFLPPNNSSTCFRARILRKRKGAFQKGNLPTPRTVDIFSTSPMRIALIDVETQEEIITNMENGMTVYLAVGGENFNIKAIPLSSTDTVVFDFDNVRNYNREGRAPYFLFGDNRGVVFSEPITEGRHSVKARATSTGAAKTVEFDVEYDCTRSLKSC